MWCKLNRRDFRLWIVNFGYANYYIKRCKRAGEGGTDKSSQRFERVYKILPIFLLAVNKINLKNDICYVLYFFLSKPQILMLDTV